MLPDTAMRFQFVHIETYARKADWLGRSTSWVLDEAERWEGSCPHVANPQPAETGAARFLFLQSRNPVIAELVAH